MSARIRPQKGAGGLPPRPSMATYAADVIRRLLDAGEWGDHLPGERALAGRIGVSRPTLHQALRLLEKEGRLSPRRNAPWTITGAAGEGAAAPRVVFLSPFKLEELEAFSLHQYALLSRYVAGRGLAFESSSLPGSVESASHKSLEAIRRQLNPSAWVLYRCSPPIQAWFANNHLPAVVMGSSPRELGLRSVDMDYRATGRHALSTLRRLGHQARHVVYLGPEEGLVGNAEAEAGLREGADKADELTILRLSEDPTAITRTVDAALQCRKVTALVVMRPLQALTIMGHLARKGVRVPQDLSLLVLDDNPTLRHVIPRPARYIKDAGRFSTLLRRAVEAAIDGREQHRPVARLMHELEPGETLGPPRD